MKTKAELATYQREWYARHKGYRTTQITQWRNDHPEKVSEYLLKCRCKKYGITVEEFNRLKAAQDNKCAVCRKTNVYGCDFHIDHDHVTNRVRGLLCNNCNLGIGYFGDEITRLQAAIDYLRTA